MSSSVKALTFIAALLLAAVIAVQTGFARLVFYELFARVKGVDVLGPTIVRVPPEDSPYDQWLRSARTEIPVLDGLVIDDVSTVALRPWSQMGEGVNGLYLRFADYQIIDGRIVEIPPRGATVSQRHLYVSISWAARVTRSSSRKALNPSAWIGAKAACSRCR